MAQPPVHLLGNRGLVLPCSHQRPAVMFSPGLPIRTSCSHSRRSHRVYCCVNAAWLGFIQTQHFQMPVELARKAVTASLALESAAPVHVHTSIIQSAPNGATVWFTTVCALSVALAALIFNLFSIIASWNAAAMTVEQKHHVVHGVDVTNSRFFTDERILAALDFATEAHAGQIRKTGEPYVSHCVETALIVEHNLPPAAEYERHVLAMSAAILHDVIDDTSVELSAIKARFGAQVASMVCQVSKLSQMNQLLRRGKRKGWAEYGPQHFKALRKMIVDMVFEEPLVILIKLADRLHNMRTVFVLKPEKQRAVAEETMEVWCTMAECLGWDALKSEMEDLCFAVLQPQQYCALRAQLDKIWSVPSLKVVIDEADSSSLPANALAPAPRFSERSRKLAAASAARKAAATAQAAVKALVHERQSAIQSHAGPTGAAVALAAAPVSLATTTLATLEPPAAPVVARSTLATDSPPSCDAADLNLGIRIIALPRGTEDHDASSSEPNPTSPTQASWDLVNWSMDQGTLQVQRVDHTREGSGIPGGGLCCARHTHPDVLLQAWAGTLPSTTVQEVTAATVAALVCCDTNSIQTATTSKVPGDDTSKPVPGVAVHAQRQRLQAHAHTHTETVPAESLPTANATATTSLISDKVDDWGVTSVAAAGNTTTRMRSTPSKLLTAKEIEAVLSGDSVAARSIEKHVTASSHHTSPAPDLTPLAPVLYTAEQLATPYLHLTAATSGMGSSVVGSMSSSILTVQQERLKSLLATVVPFDSVNFKESTGLATSTRRGLEVLDECAELLYSEVQLRSSGAGLGLRIQGRLKSLQSVYRKMVRKGCSVAEVYDARALRVIVDDEGGTRMRDSVETCYKLVSTIHSIWKPIPNEFDDYIANPKPSGYQALHTAVKGPGGVPMEVQIKTAAMHELAEYGAAAHWVYKEYAHLNMIVPAFTPSPIGVMPQTLPAAAAAGCAAAAPAAVTVTVPVPGFVPRLRVKGRGWAGQPVLRIAKDKLRYGVVTAADTDGRSLLVAVKSGPTSEAYPIRVPDYSFYRSLMDYAQAKGWGIPGCSDFTLRLEEYVLASDGRYHRKDHMGYLLPAEVITLLDGYEEDADAMDRLAHSMSTSLTSTTANTTTARRRAAIAARESSSSGSSSTTATTATTAAAAATASTAAAAATEEKGDALTAATGTERRRQMQGAYLHTYLRTQQLRAMIEWGRAAMSRYHTGGAEPGDEVSVLVWPGGTIEHWPRGTTVAQMVRAKGIVTLSGLPDPPEIRPSATAVAGGDDGWLCARDATDTDDRVPFINVNNRLVREDSVLNDGDLIILAREKVKI